MGIVKKIREHGIRESVKIGLRYHIIPLINKAIYYICWIVPVNKKLIVMESEGDLSDNAYALYDYMRHNGYLKKYKVVWLVDDVESARNYGRSERFENTEYCIKVPANIQPKRSYYMSTCKWYIYDHCNLMAYQRRRKQQEIVYLSHGGILKEPKGTITDYYTNTINYITGKHFLEGMQNWTHASENKIFDLGFPRNDYFFVSRSEKTIEFAKKLNLNKFDRLILWMSTFRKSNRKELSEEYATTETGLPMLNTANDLMWFNSILKKRNAICIIKPHHLQLDYKAFNSRYSNILFLRDGDLKKNKVQLYEFINISNALITDYSSVGFDYMLTGKPIIYTVDDIMDYKNNRGFIRDIEPLLIGYKCVDINEFEIAIDKVCSDLDEYDFARKCALKDYHTHADGNSSKRIVEHLGL